MEIPIQNIYYLLCYSWNKLEEQDIVNVNATTFNDVMDLYAQVLINGCTHLFKKGLDRNYLDLSGPVKGIKGKVDFAVSLKQDLFHKAQSHCHYDELDYDVLHNQLLKSTIYRLIKIPRLDKELRKELAAIYKRFDNVSTIRVQGHHFSQVMLHRNNYFYDFLLKICHIIHDSILVTEDEGKYGFKSFTDDEKRMRAVFERFAYNFYDREQQEFKIKRERIRWSANALTEDSESLLPQMQTDISLISQTRKIIIDTKYYVHALTSRFEKEKLRSAHLYQLFAYLKNSAEKGGIDTHCEGILLYPTVNQELNEVYQLGPHILSIKTVDLNQHWQVIHKRLLDIVKNPIITTHS